MRTHHHADFDAAHLAAERRSRTAAVVPAKECAQTVGAIVATLSEHPLVDEVVVVDAASEDGTADVARAAGARVHQEAELDPEAGPPRGKGDAMWRALGVVDADLVAFFDGDTPSFGAHYATGLLGPLLSGDGVDFVKGFYRRPLGDDPSGGGRVNHLMARPALKVFFPELAGVLQPLAGEVAARRTLLERIPFALGYGVETAMLIDVARTAGVARMAQVDLDVMVNRHQPLQALTPMAEAVLRVISARRGITGVEPFPERPPRRP